MSALSRPGLVALVLIVAQVAATVSAFLLTDLGSGGLVGLAPFFIGFACGTSQAVLLGTWLTLGGGSLLRRSLATVAVGLGMACLYGLCISLPVGGWSNFTLWMAVIDACILAPLIGAVAIGGAARFFRWRWKYDAGTIGPNVRFSIAEMFGAVVVAAVCLMLARWMRDNAAEVYRTLELTTAQLGFDPNHYATCLLIGASFFAPSLAAALVAVDRRPRAVFLLGAIAAVYGFGVLAWFATVQPRPGDLGRLTAIGSLVAMTLTVASFLVLRAAGWRLEREARIPRQPAESLIDAALTDSVPLAPPSADAIA